MISFEEARAHDPSKKDEVEIDYKKLYESERKQKEMLKAENEKLKKEFETFKTVVVGLAHNTQATPVDRWIMFEIFNTHQDDAIAGKEFHVDVRKTHQAVGVGHDVTATCLRAIGQTEGGNYHYDQGLNSQGGPTNDSKLKLNIQSFPTANLQDTPVRQAKKQEAKERASKREQKLLKTCPDCGADMKIGIVSVCINCNHAEPDQEYYAKDVTLLINEDDAPPVFIEESTIPPVAPAPYSSSSVVHHIVPSTPPIAHIQVPEGMEEI